MKRLRDTVASPICESLSAYRFGVGFATFERGSFVGSARGACEPYDYALEQWRRSRELYRGRHSNISH